MCTVMMQTGLVQDQMKSVGALSPKYHYNNWDEHVAKSVKVRSDPALLRS